MGNDFIERLLKKCDDNKKYVTNTPVNEQDVKFILKNSFDVELGRMNKN